MGHVLRAKRTGPSGKFEDNSVRVMKVDRPNEDAVV